MSNRRESDNKGGVTREQIEALLTGEERENRAGGEIDGEIALGRKMKKNTRSENTKEEALIGLRVIAGMVVCMATIGIGVKEGLFSELLRKQDFGSKAIELGIDGSQLADWLSKGVTIGSNNQTLSKGPSEEFHQGSKDFRTRGNVGDDGPSQKPQQNSRGNVEGTRLSKKSVDFGIKVKEDPFKINPPQADHKPYQVVVFQLSEIPGAIETGLSQYAEENNYSEKLFQAAERILLAPYSSNDIFYDNSGNNFHPDLKQALDEFKKGDPKQSLQLAELYLIFINQSLNDEEVVKRYFILASYLNPELTEKAHEELMKWYLLKNSQIQQPESKPESDSEKVVPTEELSIPPKTENAKPQGEKPKPPSGESGVTPNPSPQAQPELPIPPLVKIDIGWSPVMIAQFLQGWASTLNLIETPHHPSYYEVVECSSIGAVLDFCDIRNPDDGSKTFIILPQGEVSTGERIQMKSIADLIRRAFFLDI